MLTENEESLVKKLSKKYYDNVIRTQSFDCKNRLFGLEIEFTLLGKLGKFSFGSAEIMSDALSEFHVVPEFGSFQIEMNPPPKTLRSNAFQELYQYLQKIREKMELFGDKNDMDLLPIGIPFHIDPLFYKKYKYIAQKQRYLISSNYFQKENKKGAAISFIDGNYFYLPGNSGLSIINELHIHLQALNIKDLIHLFNYSQMITAPLVSLGANSGITNGKELINKEHQIAIFEQAEGLYDGAENVPRVGLFPGYINSIDDYFYAILSFKPFYFPENESGEAAFEIMLGKYFGWTRIRVGYKPSAHMRIEFRPLSTQPTILENVALSEFYVKTILGLIQNNHNLLPERFLRKNLDESIKNGMNALLFWDFGNGIQKYPVNKILKNLRDLIDNGEFIEIIEERIKKQLSPSDKIIKETKYFSYESAIHRYKECFKYEKPYI